MSAGGWLRVDERTDVLASLSECLHCVRRLREEPPTWKWVILSIHNALQGAMVCHLSGTAQLGALEEKSVTAAMDWHDRDGRGEIGKVLVEEDEWGMPTYRAKTKKDEYPAERLANATTLFERLGDDQQRVEPVTASVISITPAQRKSFLYLNNLRNNFVHFTPKGWSVETTKLPHAVLDILAVLAAIAADPWPFRHMTKRDLSRLNRLLRQLRSELMPLM